MPDTATSALWVAAISAGFTACSASIIAWQAFETRRSATASQIAAIDAARQRRDARSPVPLRVRLDLDDYVYRPSAGGLPPRAWGSDLDGPIGTHDEEKLQQLQMLRVQVKVTSQANHALDLDLHNLPQYDFSGEFDDDLDHMLGKNTQQTQPIEKSYNPRPRVSVGPGETTALILNAEFPIAQWIANSKAAAEGRPPPNVAVGTIVVTDSYNDGVTDTWTITLTGETLQSTTDDESIWVVSKNPRMMSTTTLNRRRTYYIDKSQGIALPDLPGTPSRQPTYPCGLPDSL